VIVEREFNTGTVHQGTRFPLTTEGASSDTVLESIAGLRTPKQGVIRIGARTLFDSRAGVDLPPHARLRA